MGGAKNCPETPRQKMISMMYLVLTAMLALNVSTDILNGFSMVDDSLHSTIDASNKRNAKMYVEFREANDQNPEKTKEWYEKALVLQEKANDVYNYIESFKTNIAILADGQKEVDARIAAGGEAGRGIKGTSNFDVTGQYAIVEGHGAELKQKIYDYRDYMIELVDNNNAELVNEFKKVFACERGWNSHEKDSCDWEVAVFDGMVVGASVTILTKMQNDVRSTEGEMLQFLMDQTDAGDLRVNKFNAYVIPKSDYVIKGGKYSAQIILAAVDSTQRPEYYIEGQRINDEGLYEVSATSTGVKTFRGHIAFTTPDGELQEFPFEREYSVGEPSVTISNTEMNVMYSGYNNKYSISVPGISSEKVKVTASGASISKQGAIWIIKPNDGAKNVTLTVLAEMDGKTQSMGSQEYRVKPLPKPQVFFMSGSESYNEGKVAKKALTASGAHLEASYGEDGILDLPFEIVSFQMYVGNRMYDANGSKLTPEMIAAIGKTRSNDLVNIMTIKYREPGGKINRLSGISLFIK